MIGYHHCLNEHEFEQTLGDSEGQGSLACCSPSGSKESGTLEAAQGAPRAPRRDSRGQRSPWLPLETRPDSPGEPGMQPRPPRLSRLGTLKLLPCPQKIKSVTVSPSICHEVMRPDAMILVFCAQRVSGPSSSCVWNPRVFADDARGEAKDSAVLSSRDAGLLEPPERPQGPHVQGKRTPSKTAGTERGHQRADRRKPQSQGTLKSLLQHHSSKASILWRSAFFTVQLSRAQPPAFPRNSNGRWGFPGPTQEEA